MKRPGGVAALVLLVALACVDTATAQTTTVTFDSPAPPGSSFDLLNGEFQGIDFGIGQWRWEGPYNVDPTNHIFFDSPAGTSRTFRFSPAPRILTSLQVFTTGAGTLTLSDDRGQTVTRTVETGAMQLVTTGWAQASTVITVAFTSGQNLGIDDITYSVAGGPDPAQIGQWAGPFDWPMVAVHMMLSPTGQVLAWDRENGGGSARLWNPATETFTLVPSGSNLFCGGHSTLADGRTLVVGGEVTDFVGIRDANVFDPATQRWTAAAPMAYPRWYPTATTLPDGRVLVTSGSTTCSTCIADIPEVYDPATNTWTPLPNARLTLPLYPFMFVLPDGRVVNAGSDEASLATRVLDVQAQTWTMVDPAAVGGGSAAMYRPGRVMKSGSPANVDLPSTSAVSGTWVIDMTQPAPAWRETAPMAFPRAHHNLTLLPDGTVLVVGGGRTTDGVDLAQAVYAAEQWSPETETWATLAAMQVPRLYHSTALLLPDGRVLVAGGGRFGDPQIDQLNAEVYSPPYLFRGARPTITLAPNSVGYGSDFLVTTPDASSIARVSLVRLGAVTHSFDQDQRFLDLSFQPGGDSLAVQAPLNANLAPPGAYLLFLLNSAGVPSVAAFVSLAGGGADSTPPTVTITAPTSNPTYATSSSPLALGGTAADDVGVTQVTWANDRGGSGTAGGATSWSVEAIALQPGPNVLTVTARDAVGNPGTDTLTVTYTPPATGLVAAYAFNEGAGTTVTDASGNGNTGVISGATRTTQGRFSGALAFDGVNDWVTVPDAAALDLTTGLTLAAWVYPTVSPTAWRTVVAKEGTGSVVAYFLHASSLPNNQPATGVNTGGTEQQLRGGTVLPVNTWTHLAATYDGTALRLYVNGVQVASRAQSGAIVATTNPLRIGGNSIWGEYFQGRIDEVRIYNRALSQDEIQGDMNTPVSP